MIDFDALNLYTDDMSKQQVLDYIQKLRIHNSESQTPMPDQYFVELIRMVEQLG